MGRLLVRRGVSRHAGAVTGVSRYRDLLGRPHAGALLGWSMLGRLPLGMTPLALLFLVRAEGYGYGAAGVAVALYSVALGIGAPVRGRQVDRDGPSPVLRVRALVYPALLAAVVALAVLDAGVVPITVVAAVAGFSFPPLSASVRIVWPRIAPDELRTTAYALEAALQEVFFVGGPLLAAALAAIEPTAAVAGAGLACLVGATATSRLEPVRATPPSRSGGAGLLGALGSSGIRTAVLYALTAGVAFGSVELAMPAFAEERGARELGGIAIACFAGGSLVGGLLAGMRPSRNHVRRLLVGAVALSVALLGLQLAVSLPTLCVLAFVAGLPIAPTVAALYTLIDSCARTGTAAEAFAWFGTAVSLGIATGTALAGVVVDERGVGWAFGFGAAVAFAGVLLAWARRSTFVVHEPSAISERAGEPSTLLSERP